MKIIVTGAAGFIGSHLTDRLLTDGHDVVGIDCFTDYYDENAKRFNLKQAFLSNSFLLIEDNVSEIDQRIIDEADIIFHLAGQPGVRSSWGEAFESHVDLNIRTTQKLLERCKSSDRLKRFVFASSSSVYGDTNAFPLSETTIPQPVSPYGVTKLAAENLCRLYAKTHGIPVSCLRYFTVYGPRQRPDMAFRKFLTAIRHGREINIYGDGNQTRDFTHIEDIVEATVRAAGLPPTLTWALMNIGSGRRVTLNKVLKFMESATGKQAGKIYMPAEHGDMRDTRADISEAARLLDYRPAIPLIDGLMNEYEWLTDIGDFLDRRKHPGDSRFSGSLEYA